MVYIGIKVKRYKKIEHVHFTKLHGWETLVKIKNSCCREGHNGIKTSLLHPDSYKTQYTTEKKQLYLIIMCPVFFNPI